MTEQEIERLFSAIKDPRDTAMFRVAYHRGLRASELGLLLFEDFDGRRGRLMVRRLKGSDGGDYLLTDVELRSLRAWIRRRGSDAGPLFLSRNHQGIRRTRVWELMKKYCAAAGVPASKAFPHALKHSCATHQFALGRSLELVRDHLGHVNIQNTLIYAKIRSKQRDDAARVLKGWK